MAFKPRQLPYELDALLPFISKETLTYHYGKHYQGYINKLNTLTENTPHQRESLQTIVLNATGAIFNNAAQALNHEFYFDCMAPNGAEEPSGALCSAIRKSFVSFEHFKELFIQSATTHFGSGWTWLTKNKDNELEICSTMNANTPLTEGKTPLLVCDVWEHAYYIDTRNDRAKYVSNFWKLVNWDWVMQNFES